MTSESRIFSEIRLALNRGPTRLFRQNVGQGWVGEIIRRTPTEITLRNYRPFHAGLCAGSSDLIGWHSGRFLAIEVKRIGAYPKEDQERFIAAVRAGGGLAGVARSVEDAEGIIKS